MMILIKKKKHALIICLTKESQENVRKLKKEITALSNFQVMLEQKNKLKDKPIKTEKMQKNKINIHIFIIYIYIYI